MLRHFSHVWLCVSLWTIAYQVPLSMGFSRQEYWSGCHFLLQGIFLTQGSNWGYLHWQVYSLPLSHQGTLSGTLGGRKWEVVLKRRSLVELFKEIARLSNTEKPMAPHSSTFAWKIPWMEEPGRLQSMGSLESDTTERLHFHFSLSCIGEGNGNPLQCSCLENPRDGEAWWGAISGVAQSRTRLKQLSSSSRPLNRVKFIFWLNYQRDCNL